MTRTAAALMVGAGLLAGTAPSAAPPQDALALLRSALGGDEALRAIQTIRARGTIAVTSHNDHFEIAVAFPDRFVQAVRTFRRADAAWATGEAYALGVWQPREGPVLVGNYDDTSQHLTGFNGEMPLPAPSPFVVGPGSDAMARRLDRARARLAEFLLPLMGRTPSSYPVEATSEGPGITFRAAGDREWRLEVDAVTHLPARMTWSYPLRLVAPGPSRPREVQTEFSNFKSVGDVRWPHRLVTRVDGTITEEATVERYELNVKLADRIFRK